MSPLTPRWYHHTTRVLKVPFKSCFHTLEWLSMRVSSRHTVYKDSSGFNTSLQSTKKPQIREDWGFLLTVNQEVLDGEPHEVFKVDPFVVKDVMRAMNRPSFAFRAIEDNRVGSVLIFEG